MIPRTIRCSLTCLTSTLSQILELHILLISSRLPMLRFLTGTFGFQQKQAEMLLPIIDRFTSNKPRDSGAVTNKVFGINYYQYSKFEADLQYYLPVLRSDNLAMRLITGVGTPQSIAGIFFPNTRSTEFPFERQFYVGGANTIRAWKLRTPWPGFIRRPLWH